MSYQVKIEKVAVKQLKKIPNPDYNRLKTAILALSNDPRPAGYKKLKGRSGYRIRVGNYRVIYEIKDQQLIVLVLAIGDRKDIYK